MLSAIMFPLPLGMLTLYISLTPYHKIIPTPVPTIKVVRVTPILSIKTLTLISRVPCSRRVSNIELLTTHLLNPNAT